MENPITFTLGTMSEARSSLSREETLQLRSQYIPSACKLHFEKSPMKVARANAQYLYDDKGNEILDCVNCVTHVGHCNSTVVEAAKRAMFQMGSISIGVNDNVEEYVSKLKATFPPEIDTFLFVSSASEANDLAIQMARMYTGAYDVVSVERSFHGGVILANCVSPRQFNERERCPEWVHVVQCPDVYRGIYQDGDAVQKYCLDATNVMQNAIRENRKLACFISEPIMTVAGIIVPPSEWTHSVYNDIRSLGGITIADEAQSGLGRNGTAMWSFQLYDDLVPDIITIGKPLGNGHPMACIATKSSIAATLLGDNQAEQHYACDAVSAAVGLAVLNTIRLQSLQLNARNVGDFLREGIRALGNTHQNIGEVRGKGLMVGVEIVYSQESRQPAPIYAERITYKMLSKFIIVANDGPMKNILIFTPPMCFTCENAHQVIVALDKILKEIEETPFVLDTQESRDDGNGITGDRLLSMDEFLHVTGQGETERDEDSDNNALFGNARETRRSSSSSSQSQGPSSSATTTTTDPIPGFSGSLLEDFDDNDSESPSNSYASMD